MINDSLDEEVLAILEEMDRQLEDNGEGNEYNVPNPNKSKKTGCRRLFKW
jgi:hypothetical protein